MESVAKHVHAGGIYVITFVATLVVVNVLVRTAAAKHPNSTAWQAAAYVI
jgi:hypothetical protein